jgi:hypothetical protein
MAGAAADANGRVDFRYRKAVPVRDHMGGLGGTVLGTRPAGRPVFHDDAGVPVKLGPADLYMLLGLKGQWLDGPGRADAGAGFAFILAVAEIVVKDGLEKP